jgi:hypothetical protein
MMQAMGIPANGQVAVAVAQRGVLQNPGGATGNLGGAAAGVARRGLDGFRKEFKRQVLSGQGQATQGQAAQGQATQGQAAQGQAAQGQAAQGQATQGQAGQIQAGQAQAGQAQAGQAQVGQAQAGQAVAGTPTNNQNPVAAKLLLAPTFTPIAATAVLDQTNMRVAIPVRQVDGEFILTMQDMGLVAAVQPAAAAAAAPAAAANGTAPAVLAPAKRQDSNTDKYGQVKPAQNAVIMTMKMVDDMVNAVTWGGQPGITQMMSEYVKAQTGNDLPKITV